MTPVEFGSIGQARVEGVRSETFTNAQIPGEELKLYLCLFRSPLGTS
jgi:hypothetical protein